MTEVPACNLANSNGGVNNCVFAVLLDLNLLLIGDRYLRVKYFANLYAAILISKFLKIDSSIEIF